MNAQMNKQQGFTMVELIVGLGLTMASLVLFAVVLNTIPLTRNARNQNIAYHIAAKKMESLRNTEFENLPSSGPFVENALGDLASSSASLLIEDYQESDSVKHATVIIVWDEAGKERNLQIDSLIYEHGVGKK